MRRTVVALATLCLLAGQIIFAGAVSGADPSKFTATPLTPQSTFSAPKSTSGQLAKSDAALLGRTDATVVNVVVKYDVDASASYTGGINGLAATSPRVTGKSLKANAAAVKAYDAYTASYTGKVTAAAKKAVSGLKVNETYTTAYGGVSARIPADQIGTLLKVPGVVAVQEDTLEQPQDDNTGFIGATAVWPSLGGSANAGSNVIVGVIDTGVWPEHPMLAQGSLGAPAGGLKACQFGNGSDVANLGAPFTCNNKLIGAYAKTANYVANVSPNPGANEFCNAATGVCSARDSEGHGTHTTTTAAGDCVDLRHAVRRRARSRLRHRPGRPRDPVPRLPGPGLLRLRLGRGRPAGHPRRRQRHQLLDLRRRQPVQRCRRARVPRRVQRRDLRQRLGRQLRSGRRHLRSRRPMDDHGRRLDGTASVRLRPPSHRRRRRFARYPRHHPHQRHLEPDPGRHGGDPAEGRRRQRRRALPVGSRPGAATGKIVACQRGTNGRIDKGRRVLQGGAAGMILYNPVKQDQESDNHYLPAIHIDGPSAPFTTFVTGHTNVMATWAQGTSQPGLADMMAAFSSRGPLGDWIKPDVTAPGVQVLAGTTPQPDQTTADNGPTGNLYMAIAGTSMSSPHSAGVSALVKAAHPSWTPAEIKSALMTSSVQTVVKEDGVTPATPFDMGAGSIRADRAVNPTLVFDESYADMVAAGTDPLHRINLNIASIDATTMTGEITTSRTAINVSGKNQDLAVSVDQAPGTRIIVSHKAPGPDGAGSGDNEAPPREEQAPHLLGHPQRAERGPGPVLRAHHARLRRAARRSPSRWRSSRSRAA